MQWMGHLKATWRVLCIYVQTCASPCLGEAVTHLLGDLTYSYHRVFMVILERQPDGITATGTRPGQRSKNDTHVSPH